MKFKQYFLDLREKYQSSITLRIAFWVIILALSLVIAFSLEYLFFAPKHRVVTDLTADDVEIVLVDIEENNGVYTVKSSDAYMLFVFPESYVYKFTFYGKSETGDLINYEAYSEETYPVHDYFHYPYFSDNEEIVIIDGVTNEIRMDFISATDQSFTIEDIQFDYSYELLNPIRIISSFIICFLVLYSILLLTGFRKFKYEKIALVLLLGFGILLSAIVPPKETYDEYVHLLRAVYISDGTLNVGTEDMVIPSAIREVNEIDYYSLEQFYSDYDKVNALTADDLKLSPAVIPSSSYLFLAYIFSSLGITVAKLFHIPYFFYTFMARSFNLIFYAIAAFFAIKWFKFNKPLMFFISLVPIMLSMGVSIGTSVIQNGFLLLGLGYLCYLKMEKEDIAWWEYLLLAFFFFMVTVARVTCGFFMLLMLLLQNKKFKSKIMQKGNKIFTILLFGLSMGIVFLYSSSVGLELIPLEGVSLKGQLGYILRNPILAFQELWNYITITFFEDYNIFLDLGYIAFAGHLAGFYTFLAGIFMIFLTIAGKPDLNPFETPFSKLLLWITFLGAFGSTALTLYLTSTGVGAYYIGGLQARYLMSILIIPLLSFETKSFNLNFNKKTLRVINVFIIIFLNLLYVGTIIKKYYS